jgi:N-acetyl sugar amidotransferase
MILSEKDPGYKQCAVSVMDNIADPDIRFDAQGICNYVYDYQAIAKENLFTGADGEARLEELLDKMRNEGKDKQYDCVTGISGGVDSSYLILMAKKWGLRPLIVHFDNGWNSEIAVRNINNIIKHTGYDLYTIVVDWEEFKDLQLAYIKASVVDIEVPTDHAISGTLQRLAVKYKIKYILSGNNVATEAILPPSWIYNKNDYVNLTNIHKQFGSRALKTYPLFGPKEQYLYGSVKGIHTVKPLNYLPYEKQKAKEAIIRELEWTDYGGKHYESVFTKFYQAYILPQKFHIDKRKAHLSNMIFSGQLTKTEALEEMKLPLYEPSELREEKDYVLKKFGLSTEAFDALMKLPRVEHSVFGKQKPITETFPLLKVLRPLKTLIKGRREKKD